MKFIDRGGNLSSQIDLGISKEIYFITKLYTWTKVVQYKRPLRIFKASFIILILRVSLSLRR